MAKGTLTVRVLGDTKPLADSVGNVGKKLGKFAAIGTAAFAAAGAAAVGGAFKVAAFGDEIAKTSQKAGLGVEQMQELRFAFGQGGVDATKFDTAVQKFNKNLGEAATTGGASADAFKTLGVSLKDGSGNIRDTGAVLDEVLPKLAGIESDAERAALAGDLLGMRAGPELAAALADGGAGIDAAREKAQELGIVMSEDAAAAAEVFTDQWDDITQSAGALLRQGLTPVMEFLSSTVFPALQDGIGLLGRLKDTFDEAGGGVAGLKEIFGTLADGSGEMFAGILTAAQTAIASVVTWLAEGGFTTIFQAIIDARERMLDAALVLFPALLDAAVQFLPQLVEWIAGTMIPQVLDFIVTAVPQMLESGLQLFTSLIDAVVEVLPTLVGTLVGDVLPTVLQTILGMIPQLLDAAVVAFTTLVDAVVDILPTLLDTLLGDVLPAVLGTVLDMIPQLLDAAITTFLAIVDAVIEVLPTIIDVLVGTVLPAVIATLLEMIPVLLDAGIQVFTALVDALPEVLPELIGVVLTDLVPAVVDAVMQLVPALYTAGREIIAGLIRGIGSMIGSVGDAIGAVAGRIRDALPFSPAKVGPLSGSGSPDRAGVKIGRMVADGLTSTVSDIARAADRAAGAATISSTAGGTFGGTFGGGGGGADPRVLQALRDLTGERRGVRQPIQLVTPDGTVLMEWLMGGSLQQAARAGA